jgi:plastocyanin
MSDVANQAPVPTAPGATARAGPSRPWLLLIILLVAYALAGPAVIVARNLPRSGGASATVAGAGGQAASTAGAASAAASVGMAGLKFSPATLPVRKGTRVVFDNNDTAPHTVTSLDGAIDSGVLNPGQRFSLVVTAGFKYKCSIHPFMTASVVVAT